MQKAAQAEAAAAIALQRQRSSGLIAAEKEQVNAIISLQRQRSAALISAEKEADSAVSSLQRQRSAAIIAAEKEQINTAVSLQRQRSAAMLAQFRQDAANQQKADRERLTSFTKAIQEIDKLEQKASTAARQTGSQTAAAQVAALLTSAKGTATAGGIASTAIEDLSSRLNIFVGQRIPLVGGAFLRLSENLRGFHVVSGNTEGSVLRLGKVIDELSVKSGKTSTEIQSFLQTFAKIETQAGKDTAAINFFGAATAQNLVPQLSKASSEISALSAESTVAAGGLAGLLGAMGPVGIAAVGIAVQVGLVVFVLKQVADVAIAAGEQLFDLAKSAAGFRGNLFDLSQQTGVSVETLSALEVVAKTTGTDIDSLTASLGIFQRKLEEAQDPTTKIAGLFRELGVDSETTEGALRQTLAAIAAMPEGFEQTAKALELFGRGGKAFLAIAKEANGDIDATIKKLRELGLVVSTEDAVAADKFNDQLAILQFQFRSLVGKEVIPAAIGAMEDLSKLLKDNRESIHFVGSALGLLADGMGNIVKGGLRNLQIGIGILNTKWQEATVVIELLKPKLNEIAAIYQTIATAAAFIAGHPLPGTPAAPPEIGVDLSAPKFEGSASEKGLQLRIQALKELTGFQAAAAEDAKRIGETRIKEADDQFKRGEVNRREQLALTLSGIKQNRDAELNGIAQQQALKRAEFDLAQKQNADATSAINELAVLDGKKRAVEDKFIQETKTAKAQARADELEASQKHDQAVLSIFLEGSKNRIAAIEQERDSGKALRENAILQLDAIEAESLRRRQENIEKQLQIPQIELESRKRIGAEIATLSKDLAEVERKQIEALLQAATRAALDAEEKIKTLRETDVKKRETSLTEEKQKTIDPAEIKRIDGQLQALDAQRTENERLQAIRRSQITQNEADIRTQILLGNYKAAQEVANTSDKARILSQQALADAEIQTAAKAAKAVSEIQRSAVIRDAAFTKAEKLRSRQEELRLTLEAGSLELEARKKIKTELSAISTSLANVQRKQIEDLLDVSTKAAQNVEARIKALQEAGFRKRETTLAEEKLTTTDPAVQKKINAQLQALDVERSEAEKQQAERRKKIVQDEADIRAAILIGNFSEIQRVGKASDEARAVALKTLSALRIKTEEDTALAVTQIQREATERDSAATRNEQLRLRQEQLRAQLEGPRLEIETRQRVNAELAAIGRERVNLEKGQIAELLAAATKAALDVEEQIRAIQEADFTKRKVALTEEKPKTNVADQQKITEQLKALDLEQTEAEKVQSARRIQIAQDEADTRTALFFGNASEIKRIGAASDAARINDLRTLALLSVSVEKDTADAVSRIRREAGERDSVALGAEQLRRRQEELKGQLEGSKQELAARAILNAELDRISTERANRERRQIEDILKAATSASLEAVNQLKAVQDVDLDKRKADLTGEKLHTTDPAEVRRINSLIAGLDVQRTANEGQQSAIRKQIAKDEADIRAQILSGSLKTAQEIGAATDKAQIATQKALAASGIQSAEDTANAISQIQRDALLRDAELRKTERLRSREDEIRQILQGGNLEVEARKSINAELAQIAIARTALEKKQVEDLLKAGTAAAIRAEEDIKREETKAFDAREAELKNRLKQPIDVNARQTVNDQLVALQVEREESTRKSELRINQVYRDAGQTRIEILTAEAETALQLLESRDARQIANIKAFVALRIKTEEQAEQEILAIRLEAIDRQIAAVESERTKALALLDPLARAKQEAALNNQLKILADQRLDIELQGERNIEEGRQTSLENERKYANDLISIRQRILDTQRETEQLAINLLVQRRAPQAQIIAAQLKLDLANLKTRHDAIQASINDDKRSTDERIATVTKLIASLEAAGKKETDVYKKATDELARANARKTELHHEEEAELRRTEEEKKLIRDEAARKAAEAGPGGGFLSGLQTGQLTELEGGIKSFSDAAVVAFSAVGAAIHGVAEGVGSLIQNWVLMGETGPNAFRKVAASILASIAQQAATLAIMSLAYAALSTTVVGAILLGGSPAQFLIAAALFGAVAAGAALAGRLVAGNAFKTASGTKGTGPSGNAASTSEKAPEPVDIGRRNLATPQSQTLTVNLGLKEGIVAEHFRRDYDLNGVTRLIIQTDGQG